jgi:hypothetical protein
MPQQTKAFRVFVSSTFDDLKTERKLLQEEVFPKLERLCLEKGARFQAIDLRWGVNNKKAGLLPEQSPCLELPDEVWEEPGLLSECPKCGEKLKFNPFVVGNFISKSWWKFWKK